MDEHPVRRKVKQQKYRKINLSDVILCNASVRKLVSLQHNPNDRAERGEKHGWPSADVWNVWIIFEILRKILLNRDLGCCLSFLRQKTK